MAHSVRNVPLDDEKRKKQTPRRLICKGHVTYKAVADAHALSYVPLHEVL